VSIYGVPNKSQWRRKIEKIPAASIEVMSIRLSGKGKRTDMALLRLLLEHAKPLTPWEMTERDGFSQEYHERKKRSGMYRRAILGRKNSKQPGLLQIGYVEVSEGRTDKGKIAKFFSATEEGVKALLDGELPELGKDYVERLPDQKGIETIVRVSHHTGIDPLSILKIYLNENSLKEFAEFIELATKEYPWQRELGNFVNWFKRAEPELYDEWSKHHQRISVVLRKAKPEIIEKIKKTFPLVGARWGL